MKIEVEYVINLRLAKTNRHMLINTLWIYMTYLCNYLVISSITSVKTEI